MNRLRVLVVLFCVALSFALVGCTSATTANDAAMTPEEETAPSIRESAVATMGEWAEAVAVLPADEAYVQAAQQFDFTLYRPTYLPTDFTYLADESQIGPDLVAIAYGNGDARLLVIQGIWDIGDDPDMTFSEGGKWGTLDAKYVDGIGFAWEGPAYGDDAEAVLAHSLEPGDNAAVMGVGVPAEELRGVAESMLPVQ